MANTFAFVVLLSWIPLTVVLFAWLPTVRALSVSYVAGWLLLPVVDFEIAGLPDFSKANVVFVGALLGWAVSKDARHMLGTFRLSWVDLPAGLLCVGVVVTSVLNGLGVWDGVSQAVNMICLWTGPYLLGRLAYRTADDAFELANALFIGGLCYVPLCLFELRMSPQLHNILYGFMPRRMFSIRYGGYRPAVFLEAGLELGMWMTACCVAGFVLWHQGRLRKLGPLPTSFLLAVLMTTTVFCRATGALILLAGGLACCWTARQLRTTLPLILLLCIPIAYIGVRVAGLTNGEMLVDLARQYINDERADSVESRLTNEDLLAAKALERPWFGWGGWGRSRVYDDYGNDISVTDGRWIILLGASGIVGLVASFGTLLLPCFLAIGRCGGRLLLSRPAAPIVALIVVVALFTMDCLPNDFADPIYLLCAGAVGSMGQMGAHSVRSRAPFVTSAPSLPLAQRHPWPPAT